MSQLGSTTGGIPGPKEEKNRLRKWSDDGKQTCRRKEREREESD